MVGITKASSLQSQWTVPTDDIISSEMAFPSAGAFCLCALRSNANSYLLEEPKRNDLSWDDISFQWDTLMRTPSDVSQPCLSPSANMMLPSSVDSATDPPIPLTQAEDRCSQTIVPMKPQYVHHQHQNAVGPSYTSTSQTNLPVTCFLRTSYDQLRASLSEVIHQGADASNNVLLPTKESLNIFIESYFENFSPLFPILSSVAFIADMEHYLLVLCVCTIGVSFLSETRLQTLYSMRSLLRKNLDSIVRIT